MLESVKKRKLWTYHEERRELGLIDWAGFNVSTNTVLTGYLEDGFTGPKTQPTLQQYQSTEGKDATKVRKTQKTKSLEKDVMFGTLSSHRRWGKTKTSWTDNVDWTGLDSWTGLSLAQIVQERRNRSQWRRIVNNAVITRHEQRWRQTKTYHSVA